MTPILTFAFEAGLCVLLAATLIYCVVLERRLKAVRRGQEGINALIGDLNSSLSAASASLRALQTAAGTVGEQLDKKVASARATIDELGLVTASGERIAQRIEHTVDNRASQRAPARQANGHLPSGSIMNRLEILRAAR